MGKSVRKAVTSDNYYPSNPASPSKLRAHQPSRGRKRRKLVHKPFEENHCESEPSAKLASIHSTHSSTDSIPVAEQSKRNYGNLPRNLRNEEIIEDSGGVSPEQESSGEISPEQESPGEISQEQESSGEISQEQESSGSGEISPEQESSGEISPGQGGITDDLAPLSRLGVRKRRSYNCTVRNSPGLRVKDKLCKRRLEISEKYIGSNGEITTWDCCLKSQCFRNVDSTYLRSQRSRLLEASLKERKETLLKMLRPDGKFYFNNYQVCTMFLLKAFRFSKDLQRSVKGTPKAPAPPSSSRTPRDQSQVSQKQVVISFLQTLANYIGDAMPDAKEHHLPFFQKSHVYNLLVERFESDFGDDSGSLDKPPSFSYFVATWNDCMRHVKVRQVPRFAKCHECELMRTALSKSYGDYRLCEEIQKRRRDHINFIQTERAGYLTRSKMPQRYPDRMCSIVIDGADQSSFGLPHLLVPTKHIKGEAIKVKLIGLLEHGSVQQLWLYTMTSQFETGANHIIETLHRWINKKEEQGRKLPPVMFIQLDNCSRENKNKYTFGYLESLVGWGVFEEIQVSFLPVGHTHSDIDQKFSCTSRRLKTNAAITMDDLHFQLRNSHNPRPHVSDLDQIANISQLLDDAKAFNTFPSFLQYRFFRFSRGCRRPTQGTGCFSTCCSVKNHDADSWKPFFPARSDLGFLRFVPDIRKTPKYIRKPPNNAERVTQRIDSAAALIDNRMKVDELRRLRDDIYRFREDAFHWNMDDSLEAKGNARKLSRRFEETDEQIDFRTYKPVNDVDYQVNSFVIVRPKRPTEFCPFWVAQVLQTHSNIENQFSGIKIRWYETKPGEDVFLGSYDPSFRYESKNRRRKVAWVEDVCTDAVMESFESLTRNKKLGATLVRRIRDSLKSYITLDNSSS